MNTPKTDAILASQPNGGFGLDKSQCIAQWYDHARSLETQVQELREALEKVLTQLEIVLPVTGLVHDERQAIISARAILEKTK